jgi:hypothetical protein
MAPLVEALRGLRGIDLITAVTFVAAVGDLGRFANPRQLMAYLGLVPSEQSSGERVVRGGITKTGNRDARRMLVEAAWSYRYPARVATKKIEIITRLPKAVRDIAWKAQVRLCARYRRLSASAKKPTVVVTAIARELAASSGRSARRSDRLRCNRRSRLSGRGQDGRSGQSSYAPRAGIVDARVKTEVISRRHALMR